ARSRAYRWGEDGIAGMSDAEQLLCLSLALWNGRDPLLNERLFGLINSQGNHGEDVKEEYFYLDATPSHAYLRMLYKYPQPAFPCEELIKQNARRGTQHPEYQLRDTGVFAEHRYFDALPRAPDQHDQAAGSRSASASRRTISRAGRDARRLNV
ncbi:MAG TPA: hypothetical protein VK437_04645, partial [Steroidobacteraceae bacterium]|nr:hypothetical protein [Steroidobacteraceae bacterium]